ncbi:FixH family protein [Alsobacter sp. KACC 23698]|uniref:FixH family protein n=1 Tax=Alsobacter sp. KACC 23698 TaxID=3149229 RepID=A0AAU7JC28_9HYPH
MSDVAMNDRGFRLNGRHVILILLGFFGVVFAVNGYMMHVAIKTFSGMESATPYKDGLAFNAELADARRQAELGWTVNASVTRGPDGHARIDVIASDRNAMALAGVELRATLERPADKREDRGVELTALGGGRYGAAVEGVAPGQWDLVLDIVRGDQRAFRSRSRIMLP